MTIICSIAGRWGDTILFRSSSFIHTSLFFSLQPLCMRVALANVCGQSLIRRCCAEDVNRLTPKLSFALADAWSAWLVEKQLLCKLLLRSLRVSVSIMLSSLALPVFGCCCCCGDAHSVSVQKQTAHTYAVTPPALGGKALMIITCSEPQTNTNRNTIYCFLI